jgi:dipeptidyl aminopeptidase/acylaminoacyl peptidase
MSLVHWDSWWFDKPELHWERSPLAHLEKAATPTLIVHGAADDRVHPEQSLELYTALRIKGVPTSLVFYPREPHGLNERAHQLDFIERVVAWFDEHLKPTQQARAEAAN